jgi:cytochrome c biogenesis protein
MTATATVSPSPAAARRPSPVRRMAAVLRNTWRRLTSMSTALALMFLLALGAIPGAVLPQRPLNPQTVATYIAGRPTLGPLMDRLQLFDVFASVWFTAIYALLFASLIGCLTPRIVEHAKALRAQPVPAPRNLSRLPHHRTGGLDATPAEIVERVTGMLRGWRVATREESDGAVSVSAEKGYLREAGNLVFHFSLVGLLVAIAVGKLFGYEGSVIVIADGGPGFCNTSPAVYDAFRAGNRIDGTGLEPFCVRVKDFTATYLRTGQARMFTSNISYQAGADLSTDTWRDYQLKVNDPLRVGGERVYLTGHGFAPQFTIGFPDGQTRTEAIQFAPQDATTFLSSGVLRFDPPGGTYPSDGERRRHQIAIAGLFAPTAGFDGTLMTSVFPAMREPAVAIDIYKGDAGLNTGRSQSIFALDPELISQGRLVKQQRVNLRPGQSATLADGTTVRFDGAREFVNLQVSHDPAQIWVLVSAITMLAGLVVSLVIRRRRIWVRVRPHRPGVVATLEVGGLARTDHAGWGPELGTLCERLFADPGRVPAQNTTVITKGVGHADR